MEPVDPSNKHFAYSIVKSIFRFIAHGGLAKHAGYILWLYFANEYTDIFIADAGFLMMAPGAVLFIAEVLGNNRGVIKMKFSEFRKKFGEGTDFDLDYGKLVIIGLCIYI